MGGLAACAGGAGIGALAFLALRGLLALGAFFSKARKARSARSVAARAPSRPRRASSPARGRLAARRRRPRRRGSGSVSGAGRRSSRGSTRRWRWPFLRGSVCGRDPPLQGAASLACGIISCRSPWAAMGAAAGLLGPAACARVLAVESPSRASLLSPVVAQRARVVAFGGLRIIRLPSVLLAARLPKRGACSEAGRKPVCATARDRRQVTEAALLPEQPRDLLRRALQYQRRRPARASISPYG